MRIRAKDVIGCAVLLCATMFLASVALAQYDPCDIPPGVYRTQTQGGWSNDCHGNNPGCILQDNFGSVFPSGLTVGGIYTIHFSSAAAVRTYLPASGTPNVLTGNLDDPTTSPAGVFGGQVMTLAINVSFSNAGVSGFNPDLGNLVIPFGVHAPAGPFAGWTVNQILALANQVLGGNTSALPIGISISDLNDVVDSINNNFDDGDTSLDYLVEAECDETLPVEITTFEAVANGGEIRVTWRTASEFDVARYELSRRVNEQDWTTIRLIEGLGDAPTGHGYAYEDTDVLPGVVYSYRLIVHNLDGSVAMYPQIASASLETAAVPTATALHQNYPNPFNPTTTIAFDLAEPAAVRLIIFDIMGRIVAELVNREMSAGSHATTFDATGLAGGLYFYRLEAGSFMAVRRLTLLK